MSAEDELGATLQSNNSLDLGHTLQTPSPDRSLGAGGATLAQLKQTGAYEPGNLLGKGGMGEVRLCRDPRLGRDIALKTATTRDAFELERFVREAQVQGQLQHPSIVPVHELGVGPDGAPYFTMKRINGSTLAEALAGLRAKDPGALNRFTPHRLLSAFLSVCQAVEYAHTHGWIHRDLKPANIMLGDFGEVYVLDWGLARRVDGQEAPAAPFEELKLSPVGATTPGTLLGTPGYMAPDQVLGQKADVRSDVYALGAVLFEILTLQMLVSGTSVTELLVRTRDGGHDPRARVRAPERDVSPELDALVVKATQRDAAARHASVRELYEGVERVLNGEKNVALRTGLAREHASKATAAAEQVGVGRPDDLALRKVALKEVGQALALEPNNPAALRTLVKLMTELPQVTPPEAEEALEKGRSQRVKSAGRAASWAFGIYLFDLPLMMWMGMKSSWMLAASFGLVAAAAIASALAGMQKQPTSRAALPALFISNLAIATSSLLMGPFLVLPAMAAANAIAFAVFLDKKYRKLVAALGVLSATLPIALFQLMDEAARPYSFDGGNLVLRPLAVELSPTASLVYLTCAGAGTILISIAMIGFVRNRFDELEKHRELQAWNLRQLIPPEGIVDLPADPVEQCVIRESLR